MMTQDSSLAPALSSPTVSPLTPLSDVTGRAGLQSLSNHLDSLRQWLGGDVLELEAELQALMVPATDEDPGSLAKKAASHLLDRPGKRIRPICVMLGSRLAKPPTVVPDAEAVRDLAVAAELVHAATLLHDDVIDEGTERRGSTASRVVFGNSASILAGDYLLIEALNRVRRAGEHLPKGNQPLAELLETISMMVAAEAEQLERRGRFEPDREAYLRIIDGKTATLFRWALRAGATLAGLSHAQVQAVGEAGTALGLAFQLIDDVLDLEGQSEQLGKDLFADLAQGKLTWPIIVACETRPELSSALKDLYDAAMSDRLDPGAAQAFVEAIRESGALERTRQFARQQQRIAEHRLSTLPESYSRRAIGFVLEAAVERRR